MIIPPKPSLFRRGEKCTSYIILGQGFFTFAALRSKKSLQASHGLGTWDAQTEIPCLSTRGPRKPVLIWPSMATAAAIGKPADAQRARAETCTRTRPRSCTKRPSGAIAMTPTNHPEKSLLATYMRERGVVRARAPVISEKIVGLEAQLASKRTTPSRA